eukprot:8561971-Pyramimonas_sp.AAC.1
MASQGIDDTWRPEIEDGSQYFGNTQLEDSLDACPRGADYSLSDVYIAHSLGGISAASHGDVLGQDNSGDKSSFVGGGITEGNAQRSSVVDGNISEGSHEAASGVAPATKWLTAKKNLKAEGGAQDKHVIVINCDSETGPRTADSRAAARPTSTSRRSTAPPTPMPTTPASEIETLQMYPMSEVETLPM